MVNVAVAGGTGCLGRAITEAIQTSQHRAFVLSRKAPGDVSNIGNATAIQIDYDNINGMKEALEKHHIHTVICALSINGAEDGQAQLNLIQAADASSATKRFVASDWTFTRWNPEHESLDFVKYKIAPLAVLPKTGLEWTRFVNGFFLDYYGMPHIKTYLYPFPWALDVAAKAAIIPGTGDERVTFTYTFDVARFVAAALDLPKWEPESRVIGETVTLNEFLTLAEEARGAKFSVVYDSLEKLKKGEVSELPSQASVYEFMPKEVFQEMLAVFGEWSALGLFEIPDEGTLNAKFSDLKTLTVRQMLGQYWKGK